MVTEHSMQNNGETDTVSQYPARPFKPRLTLVPPLADPKHDITFAEPVEFDPYGTKEIAQRAREWALERHYLLARGVSKCAHGLYMMDCPGNGCARGFEFDHTEIWVPDLREPYSGRPFILTQPYVREVPARMREYAAAHGLELLSGGWETRGDGWYGHCTLPIRLSITADWPLSPIEEHAVLQLHALPVQWPGDPGENSK